jgi:Tol biopolymer transport system component
VKVAPQYLDGEVAYLIKTGEHAGFAFTKRGFGAAGSMRNPAWSPDGKSVIYQKVASEPFVQNQPLFSKNAEFQLAWSNPFPAFSRNGKLVVTTGFTSALGPATLSVVDADGGNARRIFDDESGASLGAAWSPDEKSIIFGFGTFFQHQAKPARIMIMRADGSELRVLVQGPNNAGFPSFSPDGRRIVFRLWGEQEQGLRVLNMGDGSIETLTTEPDNVPHWSPTADVIEFTRAVEHGYEIFSINADGTMLKQLTNAPGNNAHAVWSPDGNFLLFGSGRLGFEDESPLYDAAPQPYAELFIMDADGSNQRPLTDNKWEDGTPAWQPPLAGN